MRTSVAQNGLTFTAYAGTTGVHLTWDADDALRQNLLGFAIKRRESRYRTGRWLAGGIGFPGQAHRPGVFMDTSLAPIQAFRWGDYTVYPATKYTYELVPMYGPWDALQPGPPATLEVRTEAVRGKPHSVAFNRAVAASQAYERRFPEVDPHNNVEARKWLCRDLDKFVLDFIAWGDGPQWALDVCIYEYELPEIRDALLAVRNAGTAVRLVYHSKTGDAQTEDNEASVTAGHWPAGTVRARKTSSIMHDKFMVLSRMQGGVRRPKAVMTGSTNFTFNGLMYQGNVAHSVEDEALAGRYLRVFEELFSGATGTEMRHWIDANNPVAGPIEGTTRSATEVIFAPRSNRTDMNAYIAAIGGARRSVFFVTAFDLDDAFLDALAPPVSAPGILRYGLQNSASRVTGYSRERAQDFTATGRLRTAPTGFRAEESHGQQGNILVHAKIVLIDFDTERPTVITGSANYSGASSGKNDENTLIVTGDTRVADIYLCEMFRLLDHYRFRYNWSRPPRAAAAAASAGNIARRIELDDTDGWTDRYYADPTDPHAVERQQLSRPLTT